MGYKSRGNWLIGACLRSDCLNRDIKCEECSRFSCYTNQPLQENDESLSEFYHKTISPTVMQGNCVNEKGDKINLSTWQRNGLYRKAKELKEKIQDGLCTKTESRIPNDKNVRKMLNSEFKLSPKINEYKKMMQAIGADPKDYNIEKLRRR